MRLWHVFGVIWALAPLRSAAAQFLPTPPVDRCQRIAGSPPDAAGLLDRATRAILPKETEDRVLQFTAVTDAGAWEQSDRPYEPFLPNPANKTHWFSARSGVEGWQPADRPPPAAGRFPSVVTSGTATFVTRDTVARPQPVLHPFAARERSLNPWAVLGDWRRRAAQVHVAERCVSRGGLRLVLSDGDERLYLAESDATPVMLERHEDEMLWGRVRVAYLWNTWWAVPGGGAFPMAAFRIVEGVTQIRRGLGFGAARTISADSAPRLDVPESAAMPTLPGSGYSVPPADTVRVGSAAFLLRALDYTEAVALRRDTVFILDATTSESRARSDSAWIARLFPGRHPIVVIVTDLAWPHIGGVKFWVARGATVVSHAMSRDLLSRLVTRQAAGEPDGAGRAASARPFAFRSVSDSLRLAGGELVVHALRGLSAEGAVAVWVPDARFIWAGDYIQEQTVPSVYARDVIRTAEALGLSPARFGAQHVPLGSWAAIKAVNAAWP